MDVNRKNSNARFHMHKFLNVKYLTLFYEKISYFICCVHNIEIIIN